MENTQAGTHSAGTPPINTMRDLLAALLAGFKIETEANGVWSESQGFQIDKTSHLDEPLPFKARIAVQRRYCNGVELDECLTEAPKEGFKYYYVDLSCEDGSNFCHWIGGGLDVRMLNAGMAYPTKESAIKHAKAMLRNDDATARLKDWAEETLKNKSDNDEWLYGYDMAAKYVLDILEGKE